MYFKKIKEAEAFKQENVHIQKKLQFISESYKNVRSNFLFALAGKQTDAPKIIMVTSSEQGDGKTTTCLNLATALADSGAKVLIIDADLRCPRMERYITSERKHKGLSDVLAGLSKMEDVIVRPDDSNFDCLYSGSIAPNPSELLMQDSIGELFEELSKKYDYIFVDTPPVGVVSETLYLTKFMAGVIVVVKKRKTYLKNIKETIKALNFAKATILGFVLNGSKDSSAKHYYYSKDRYYYYQ